MKKLFLPFLMLIVTSAYCQKNFNVTQFGTGPSVIIISDVPNAIEIWHKTIDDLKANYKLYFVTFTGENSLVTANSSHKIKKELLKYIDENHLNNSPIFGEGVGGFISLEMAFDQPFLFSKIALINTKDLYTKEDDNFKNHLAKINLPVLILKSKSSDEQLTDKTMEERLDALPQKRFVVAEANIKSTDNDNSYWLEEYVKNFLINGLAN